MRDVFGEAKQRLAREIDSHSALAEKPIAADPWVVSSLLQKSIRRGEIEIARRAALTFFKLKGSAIWRRLTVIAFEDVGIGSPDAVTMIVAAAYDSAWRKDQGSDLTIAVHLAGLIAEVPKDRSADYLCDARDHPMLAASLKFADVCKTGILARALQPPARCQRGPTRDALSKQGRFATIVNRAPERLMFEAFGAIGRVLILVALACVPCRMTRGTCAHRLQHDVGVPPA
jgi:hypothetical protein